MVLVISVPKMNPGAHWAGHAGMVHLAEPMKARGGGQALDPRFLAVAATDRNKGWEQPAGVHEVTDPKSFSHLDQLPVAQPEVKASPMSIRTWLTGAPSCQVASGFGSGLGH
ncbi:hypothetical protein KIL84_001986 [Mauremys mutica]|uniref:Uncharacterized protein n=1 Tax=Mauremys mutica TaxID=74926 RepID=A0A9D3XJW9_9SAUR|nr:hypothetical protein KIL84_001986 [Mauremys mutica]